MPVPELRVLREEHACFENIVVESGIGGYLGELRGDCLELIAEFELPEAGSSEFGLQVRRSRDGGEETNADPVSRRGRRVVRRPKPFWPRCLGDFPMRGLSLPDGETLKLHIYMDRSSVEVFGNEGRVVFIQPNLPGPDSLGVDLYVSEGRVRLINLEVWKLKSI